MNLIVRVPAHVHAVLRRDAQAFGTSAEAICAAAWASFGAMPAEQRARLVREFLERGAAPPRRSLPWTTRLRTWFALRLGKRESRGA